MRFLRRIAEIFGLGRDDNDNGNIQQRESEEHDQQPPTTTRNFQETGLPRKGFSVPVQVAVDRSHIRPLITPCSAGDGAVQGLKWYGKRLRIDEDGDIADEFIEEVPQQLSSVTEDQHKPTPRFVAKYSNRLAVVKKQAIDRDGKLQQCVVYEGKLQWL